MYFCILPNNIALLQTNIIARLGSASTPGRPLEKGRLGIDRLRMRGVFRILSSKFDRKLNYAYSRRLAPFEVKGELYCNTKNLRRVYGYQVFRVI